MPEVQKRRRRPAVACMLCRKRKIKCNREFPCSNCLRSRTGDCVYESRPGEASRVPATVNPSPKQWKPRPPILPSPSFDTAATAHSQSSSHYSSPNPAQVQVPVDANRASEDEAKRLRLRIRELEDQLARVSIDCGSVTSPVSSSIETTMSRLGGVFHLQCETPVGNGGPVIPRSMMHKTRMFGQSHWCVTTTLLIRDIFETIDEQLKEHGAEAWAGIARCKVLAQYIKTRRAPPWPVLRPSSLPDKALADALVENYLANTELLYRVLHIPTFRERYEALWKPGATTTTPPDPAFLIQVKLVLALGAVTHDDTFSLRTCAMQWANEGQAWLTEPKFKARLDVQTIQTNILLLFAQERLGILADSMWTAAGSLVRRAMFMGLHRDPARLPDRTVLACEMHRRLWNTIIELNLQASLGSGGPVSLSVSDFDTRAPANLDDAQLLLDADAADAVPRPADECTQMTVALALRETFSARLDVLRFLNDVASGGSYEETLRLDGQLRACYGALGRRLRHCRGRAAGGAKTALTGTERRVLDVILHRYLSALHVPYFVAAMHETRYAYSRVVVVDCALKVWTSLAGGCGGQEEPPSSSSSSPSTEQQSPSSSSSSSTFEAADDLRRQVTRGMSFFTIAAMHSALLVVTELRAALREEASFGAGLLLPPGAAQRTLRPDLRAVLDQAQAWALEVVRAGHTNVKGYLLLRIIAVHVDAAARELPAEALVENMLAAAAEVARTCGGLLTEMAEKLAKEEEEAPVPVLVPVPMPTPPETGGDWAFAGLDELLAATESRTEGWPANYGYSMDEFEWAMFDS